MKYLSYSHYFTWKHWGILYLVVAILSALPLISIIFASLLSQALGCGSVNEAEVPDCMGGGLIYSLFVIGWLGLITFPIGGFVMILLLIANVLWYFAHKTGQNS